MVKPMPIMQRYLHVKMSVLTLFLLAGCGDESPILTKGQAMPGFTLEQLESGSVRFPEDLQG